MEDGYTFPLASTFAGIHEDDEAPEARIRRISSVDEAAIHALPEEVQQTVWAGLSALKKFQARQRNMEDPQNLNEMLANNLEVLKAADEWCIASFIQPQLVRSMGEIKDDDTWLVTDVHPEDRVAVFMTSMDNDSAGMKKLKLFRPEREDDAQNGAPGEAAESSLRSMEPTLTGVYAEPVS
jgi:hypothetical protein